MKKTINLLLLFLLLCSCNESENNLQKISKRKNYSTSKQQVGIVIQPFADFTPTDAASVVNELKKIYTGTVRVNKPIPLPNFTLNKEKKRYRADSLISYLKTLAPENHLIIGLTNKDISHTKFNEKKIIVSSDYGIMGLGFCPGVSCIASTFRLKGNNKMEKLFKVAIHELGHTQGLQHCPTNNCLMRDAKGKDHLNEETGFCPKCKSYLKKRDWLLM